MKFNKQEGDSEIWRWWSQYPHVKYPSTLYVTVEPVDPPNQNNQPTIRSMGPLQPEQGSTTLQATNIGQGSETQGSLTNISSPPRVILWTRLPGNMEKIDS